MCFIFAPGRHPREQQGPGPRLPGLRKGLGPNGDPPPRQAPPLHGAELEGRVQHLRHQVEDKEGDPGHFPARTHQVKNTVF
jgi:hypothetical protein